MQKNTIGKLLICTIFLAALVACSPAASKDDRETVAIIGTGDLGDSIGIRMAQLGYTVIYGSRSPDSERVRGLLDATGNGATAMTPREAAEHSNIIFLPLPWPAMETVAQNLGNVDDKIIVDPSLPWTQDDDGYPANMLATSSAEMIQGWNPRAKVVKAFGTMGSMIIDRPDAAGGLVTIPLASDDRDAKERVAKIVAEMGLDPVDFGPLRMARSIEAMGLIYMIPLLQHRTEEWEFYFRRNADWVCRFKDEWGDPVFDAGNLANMPERQDPPNPCP